MDAGLILACAGCCCGHAERGGPKMPPRVLERHWHRAVREAALQGRVRLAFTDCLGPCSEANVVVLYLHGRPLWLRRMNDPAPLVDLVGWLRAASDGDPQAALPPALARRAFAWTGGSPGPLPPIGDEA